MLSDREKQEIARLIQAHGLPALAPEGKASGPSRHSGRKDEAEEHLLAMIPEILEILGLPALPEEWLRTMARAELEGNETFQRSCRLERLPFLGKGAFMHYNRALEEAAWQIAGRLAMRRGRGQGVQGGEKTC